MTAALPIKDGWPQSAKTIVEIFIYAKTNMSPSANTLGLCTEMEGAAIAQTAYRNGIPFVILRAISDKADDSAEMDYPTFEKIAAHRCAEVTCRLAKHLHEAEMMN